MADDYVSYVRDRNTGVLKEIHDEGARIALGTKYELGVGTEIPEGADLNDYKEPGVYVLNASSTVANKPTSDQITSTVTVSAVSASTIKQELFMSMPNSNNAQSFNRRCVNGTWYDWVQLGSVDASKITNGVLSIAHGGTSAENAFWACRNIGAMPKVAHLNWLPNEINLTTEFQKIPFYTPGGVFLHGADEYFESRDGGLYCKKACTVLVQGMVPLGSGFSAAQTIQGGFWTNDVERSQVGYRSPNSGSIYIPLYLPWMFHYAQVGDLFHIRLRNATAAAGNTLQSYAANITIWILDWYE